MSETVDIGVSRALSRRSFLGGLGAALGGIVGAPASRGTHQPTGQTPAEQLGGIGSLETVVDEQLGDLIGDLTPDATVAVAADGRPVLTRGYGYADTAAATPVSGTETAFRVGSVGKLLTWTAVMQGVEAGRLDLGISNFAAVAYSTEEADLYPGNRLKQDGYYFPKAIAKCDDSSGDRATRPTHKWSERRTHFFHSLAKHIVERCVEKGVGRINVGDLEGIREDESGESKNWGKHGNLDLHGWTFDRFTSILEYKAEVVGIEVNEVDEEDTSKTCCVCGREDNSQRVERGLYVCEACDGAFNAA